MSLVRSFWILSCASVLTASSAIAATQFNWNPALTGTQAWNVDGNWDQPGFPNGSTHVANLSVPLAASLTTDLGGSGGTLAGLTIGGTSAPVSTTIAGGFLTLRNDDSTFNNGNVLITAGGAATGTNFISTYVGIDNDILEFGAASSSNVRLFSVEAFGATPSIRSFMPSGLHATIDNLNITDPNDPNNYRVFRLNDSPGSPAGMSGVSTQGTLEIGNIDGYGELNIGVTSGAHPVPLGTVKLSGINFMTGYVRMNRGNLVLANNGALGAYRLLVGQPNQGVGFNLLSDNDARTNYTQVALSQWLSIKGEHSLTLANIVVQSNSRGWVNLLPADKSFSVAGGTYAIDANDPERTFTFDGTGRTLVTGGLHDKYVFDSGPAFDGMGHYRKTGTGAVFVSGTVSDYHGNTIVEAGVLRFASDAHLASSPAIISTGGALGVDTGIFFNAALLAKVAPANTGGLMLIPSEAAADLDFTAGPLANAAHMSVAAPEAGIEYTGTITPADDTYRLGGGSGTLTLPNPNQLTGDRNLLVANGGEVQLTALNDYTGTTVVNDVPFVSRTNQAIADRTSGISTDMFAPTILTVTSLESGVESSIGTSSNDAGNLVIQGSTLRHVGAGTNTLRLFSIGTRGATIETAGTGQLFFDNTAPLAILPGGAAVSRTLTLAGDAALNGMSPLIADAADGGVVGIAKDGTGTWDLHGDNTYSGPTLVRQGRLNINGTQSGGGSYTVEAGAMLGGTGVIGGDATVVGTLSPGQSVGTLVIDGSVTFDPSSEFVIEIAGIAAGSFDRLEVAGSASLDGSIRIELPDQVGGPYVPKLGDRFAILTAQGGAGEMFDAIESPPLAAGLAWALSPGDVTVFLDVVAALPGDYNFNGIVDAADYTVWRNLLGQEGTGLVADGNHDDRVDEADYGIWKSHFGSTLGSSGQAGGESSVVPEPHSLALIGTVCLSLVALTRRFTT